MSPSPADALGVSLPPIAPFIEVTPPSPPRLDPVTGPRRPGLPSGPGSFSAALASALANARPPAASALWNPQPVAASTPLPVAPADPTAVPGAATVRAAPAAYSNLTGDLDASPELLTRLNQMAAARGERWTVTSGLRTDAEQAELWANRANNPYPVARPGTSIHRTGLGADVSIGGRPIQDVVSASELRAGGLEPLVGDAVHVQLAGTLR